MRRPLRIRRSRGFALMALMALIIAGVLFFLVNALGPEAMEAYRTRKTEAAQAEARDALLGYALQYRDQQIATGTTDAMYGHLPMPDMGESTNKNGALALPCATEGCAKQNNTGTASHITYVGRFPWRTLGLEPLRDGYGECLWYIVSASHKALENTDTVNWDTLGQLDVVVADGADSLRSIVASAHDRPVAIIVSPGPVLPGQDRTNTAVDDVTQCGGNYDPKNYLDANVATALRDQAGTVTTASSYFSGATGTDTSAVNLAASLHGDILKSDDGKLWSNACPAGTNCARIANDRGIALTPDTLFGGLRKNANFRTDINTMLDRMVSCLRDNIYSGGGDTGNAKIGADDCYKDTVVPIGYYSNYKDQLFVARGALTVNGASCPAALILGNQRGSGQSRASAAEQAAPANYLEGANLTSFTGGGTVFAGDTIFNTLASGQSIQQDIVRCIPSTTSFTTMQSPVLASLGLDQLANYDAATRTLTLGAEDVIAGKTVPAGALFGCAWTPEVNTQGNGFRAYFTFQFKKVGSGVGNNGFVFAAIDDDSNSHATNICGAAGSHLGYSGDNGVTPPLTFPKIGIEFDQSYNDGFSESTNLATSNPGRNDPCGTACSGAYNSHAAIVYWGHDSSNATDHVTRPQDDDNVHGFPTPGSQNGNSRPAPQNPNNLSNTTPGGIAFVNMTGQKSEGGDSYLYHVRVEVTPTRNANSSAAEQSNTTFITRAWIVHDSATNAQIIAAMKNTTRPMAQLNAAAPPTLSDTATIYDVAGGSCNAEGKCSTGYTCGTDNVCYRPGLKTIRLGFTNSQRTQDQQVIISDFFATWPQ